MTGKFRSLCAKLLSRIVAATGGQEKGFDAKPLVHRRVEVTVERESVSILVPGQPAERLGETGRGKSTPEARPPEVLPPAPSPVSPTVMPTSESPTGTGDGKASEGES